MHATIKILFLMQPILFALIFSRDVSADAIKSKYFDIYIHQNVDKTGLIKKLQAEYLAHKNSFIPHSGENADSLLAAALDMLHLDVCDAFNAKVYNFKTVVEILPDRATLTDIVMKRRGVKVDTPSLYEPGQDTIFISYADLTLGMLIHEISHAILHRYFAVPPSDTIHEILGGYAEYHITNKIKQDLEWLAASKCDLSPHHSIREKL